MNRTIRSPRGSELTCKGWIQEAALRASSQVRLPSVETGRCNV